MYFENLFSILTKMTMTTLTTAQKTIKILYILFVDRNEIIVPLHRQWRRKDAPQLARKIFLVHEEISPHEGLLDPEYDGSKNFKQNH